LILKVHSLLHFKEELTGPVFKSTAI